ncbi:MAG TPA: DNA/RNA non-specific endonuclease [Myxococcota bacterium]|nr:DNA/RNA non-specific endonuclease [Myxococcota bacterium]
MRTFSGIAPVLAVFAGVMYIGLAGSHAGGPADHHEKASSGETIVRVPDPSAAGGVDTHVERDRRWQTYGGFPLVTKDDARYELLDNLGFDAGYSEYRKGPVWVAYRVDAARLPDRFPRPRGFATDDRTRARVAHRDYTGTGYDRGHMAPNHAIASRYGREAQLETFLMSNVTPQKPALNRETWRKLEEMEAGKWSQKLEEVWVITGPVFDDERTYLGNGEAGIDIPDAFFKVVIDEAPFDSRMTVHEYSDRAVAPKRGIRPWHRPRVLAFIVPQDVDGSEPLTEFLVSVDWIEQKTGLDLMPEVPDDVEEAIESEIADQLW